MTRQIIQITYKIIQQGNLFSTTPILISKVLLMENNLNSDELALKQTISKFVEENQSLLL
jgi:hypothetical protein